VFDDDVPENSHDDENHGHHQRSHEEESEDIPERDMHAQIRMVHFPAPRKGALFPLQPCVDAIGSTQVTVVLFFTSSPGINMAGIAGSN